MLKRLGTLRTRPRTNTSRRRKHCAPRTPNVKSPTRWTTYLPKGSNYQQMFKRKEIFKMAKSSYGHGRTGGVAGELSRDAERHKSAAADRRASNSANPVANWKSNAGTVKSRPPLAKT